MTARILVVDDLLPNVKLLEAKLTSEYYDVITARSGAECLQIISEKLVDIVLLDVMMPDMDGFETCRRLKANPDTAHIPVVMVTALSEPEDRVQGLEAGADDFLTKPINDVALFARIRSLMRVKIIMDELKLRNNTGVQLGLTPEDPLILQQMVDARILIVDDDGVQSKHIVNKLMPAFPSAKVDLTKDPSMVVDFAIQNKPDLLIISTQLTEYDGLRLCSQLRSNEATRNVPILILVDEEDTKTLVRGLDMGVNDYLVTPIDVNEVLVRVKTQIKRKRYQEALKSNYREQITMAVLDGLTGLYNRRYFDAHCETLVAQSKLDNKPLLLMLSDIDFFKKVNDTYGHVAGDEILKQFAELLTLNLRSTDLIARYGGEEFVVVMPDTEMVHGLEAAERLRKSVENKVFKISAGDGSLQKTVSMGITKLRPDDTIETMLKRADKALYVAKEHGRNQVIKAEND